MQQFVFILYGTQFPGNIGFSARVVKNFGFKELILLNSCEITSETYKFAVKAEDLVKKAKSYQDLDQMIAAEGLNYLIGTTRRIGGSKNPKRNALPSERLRSYPFPSKGKIGVLFGPEQQD